MHSPCHTGVGAFWQVAVAAENGCCLDLTVNHDPVSGIITLMADHAGRHTGQTAYTFVSVNFYSLHES